MFVNHVATGLLLLFFFFTLKFQKLQHQHTPVSFRYFIVPNQSNQNHAVIKWLRTPITKSLQVLSLFHVYNSAVWKKIRGQNNRQITPPKLSAHSNTVHFATSLHRDRPRFLAVNKYPAHSPSLTNGNLIVTLQLNFKNRRHSALQLNLKIPIQAKTLFEPNIKRTTELQARQRFFSWTEINWKRLVNTLLISRNVTENQG